MLLLSPILSFSFLFFFFFNDTATTEIYTLSLHDALPISQDRVGTAALEAILGNAGLYIMAVAIMISTFGCNNGLILSGARVYYAMARDDLFFRSAGLLHPTYQTSGVAPIVQALWTSVLRLSGTY